MKTKNITTSAADPRIGMTSWQETKWGFSSWTNFKYVMTHIKSPQENTDARLAAYDAYIAGPHPTAKRVGKGLLYTIKAIVGAALGGAVASAGAFPMLMFGLLGLIVFMPLGVLLIFISLAMLVIGAIGGVIGIFTYKIPR